MVGGAVDRLGTNDMSKESTSALFSPDLHEIGSRIVDLLNQTGFLYRFPALAGVTLACIAQHLDPMRALLGAHRQERESFGRRQSPTGYTVGSITQADPVGAAFDYAETGYRTFLRHLKRVASQSPAATPDDLSAIARVCDDRDPPGAEFVLRHKDVIESFSDEVVSVASAEFQPLAEDDWQGLRMVLFFFLLELEKDRNARG